MRGADPASVRRVVREGEALSGAGGFAGELDGMLYRDALGREPLFVERGATTPLTDDDWSHAPSDLADPDPVPAGVSVDRETGERRRVLSLPDPEPAADREAAVRAVERAVEESLGPVDEDGLAVAFSGGVDSGILAAQLDAPLYVAGFPDGHDVAAARAGAAALDREVRVVELSHGDLERAVPEVVAATGRTNAMDTTIALVLYLVAERAAEDGYDGLALGQGADELFGGYAKVANAPGDPRVEADSVRAARRETVEELPDGFARDVPALRAAGVEPVLPLASDAVGAAALELPGDLLVDGDRRKVALREAAGGWLPASIARRDKKAAQYGSLVDRELDRLARRAGFKRRMDDHVRRYVESLVAD